MALGADRGSVISLVLGAAFLKVPVGRGLGMPAIGAGKPMSTNLSHVTLWEVYHRRAALRTG